MYGKIARSLLRKEVPKNLKHKNYDTRRPSTHNLKVQKKQLSVYETFYEGKKKVDGREARKREGAETATRIFKANYARCRRVLTADES